MQVPLTSQSSYRNLGRPERQHNICLKVALYPYTDEPRAPQDTLISIFLHHLGYLDV